jgi:saccharopine dehydrogenase-like NADP-dependent oxidoreductase
MATKLILLGAGKIGDAILNLLSHTGDYEITVADRDEERLSYVQKAGFPNVRTVKADLGDQEAVTELIKGHKVTLSACPYFLTPVIAGAAKRANSHYFDLTEDVESTRVVKQLAEDADCAFVPQCGLAPGLFLSLPTMLQNALIRCATSACVLARCQPSRTMPSNTI